MKRLLSIAFIVGLWLSVAAQAAFTEFYCQSGGSNLNAGSTTSNTAAYTATNGGWNSGTGVFTPASGDPSASVAVGDFASVYTDSATVTGFVGRVTAVSSTTVTVSITAKAGTIPTTGASGISCKVGGAWQGPNGASGFPFGTIGGTLTNAAADYPRTNFKNSATYSVTAAITHAVSGPAFWQGYTSTPGDGGRATLDGGTSGASYILLNVNATNNNLSDLIFQNNGATGGNAGIQDLQTGDVFTRCTFKGMRGAGLNIANVSVPRFVVECEATGNNLSNTAGVGGFSANQAVFVRCVSFRNTGSNNVGFNIQGGAAVECVAAENGGPGFRVNGNAAIINCDAYFNGGTGIALTSGSAIGDYVENCNLVKNGSYGIDGNSLAGTTALIYNCAFGSGTQANTSGQTNFTKGVVVAGSVTYASGVTPWVDPANGDFRINLSAAKSAGRGAFLEAQSGYAGTIAYPDIGAAQHLELPSGLPLSRSLP
jgi:hypothetical protein